MQILAALKNRSGKINTPACYNTLFQLYFISMNKNVRIVTSIQLSNTARYVESNDTFAKLAIGHFRTRNA